MTIAALSAVGFLLDGLVFHVSIFAADGCGTGDPAPLCAGAGTLAMWALPWIGPGLAAVASPVLGVAAWRRGRTPWAYLPVGTLLYVAGPVGAWTVVRA
ncbi:hypothetical protein [Streptomyces sp. NK15101]|uniref:hypothetical protein n=1 Tax=Streptomyces sp. NK15101 TaxID=2873261 RepID=UPI001CEDF4F2|nr:hypothetical protein [Streptomyces sp. NK15101]